MKKCKDKLYDFNISCWFKKTNWKLLREEIEK
jgi:hypothetical protein